MRRVQLELQDLRDVVGQIWDSVFSLTLEGVEAEPPSKEPRFLTGCIQISGAWDGALVVRCSYILARVFTGLMLGIDEPADEDISDALGELTNLTAGATQALLPTPSELTPPTVIEGKEYKLILPNFTMVNEANFLHESEPLTIMLFESNAMLAGHAKGKGKGKGAAASPNGKDAN